MFYVHPKFMRPPLALVFLAGIAASGPAGRQAHNAHRPADERHRSDAARMSVRSLSAAPDAVQIRGGTAVSRPLAVGALLLDDSPHCTATLVSPRYGVTAAHCLHELDDPATPIAAARLTLALGRFAANPERRLTITRAVRDPRYRYLTDDAGHFVGTEHDFAYFELGEAQDDVRTIPLRTASLDGAPPTTPLTFVGYGREGDEWLRFGRKLAVDMSVTRVLAGLIEYGSPARNTCSGDSGGPALERVGDWYRIVGVTSYGDEACRRHGFSTRADVEADWLAGELNPPSPPEEQASPATVVVPPAEPPPAVPAAPVPAPADRAEPGPTPEPSAPSVAVADPAR